MVRVLLRLSLFLIALPTCRAVGDVGAKDSPQSTTGTRTWQLAVGMSKRMRLIHFNRGGPSATFQTNGRPFSVPLAKFSDDDQNMLAAMRKGDILFVRTPGLNVESHFPTGPRPGDALYEGRWVGESRTWTSKEGRNIEGALINLTDEDVSVLIKGQVFRLPLEKLSAPDLDYLEDVKHGKRPLFPEIVLLDLGTHWDQSPVDYRVTISGERSAALPAPGGRFEAALATALREAKARYPHDDLELVEFVEVPQRPERSGPSSHSVAAPRAPFTAIPSAYEALFRVPLKRRNEIERLWPLTISARQFGVYFHMVVLTDGTIPKVQRVK